MDSREPGAPSSFASALCSTRRRRVERSRRDAPRPDAHVAAIARRAGQGRRSRRSGPLRRVGRDGTRGYCRPWWRAAVLRRVKGRFA